MSYYGAHWRIDGVTAAFIMRGDRNGRYRIVFERESAELPQIESINWAQPSVERLTALWQSKADIVKLEKIKRF